MVINFREELYTSTVNYKGDPINFAIVAGPGSRQYRGIDLTKDRILYIRLEKDGITIEYPYKVIDQLAIWELVFDVWQKPEKKLLYANRFLKLIHHKLLQAKLEGFARAYWKDLGVD